MKRHVSSYKRQTTARANPERVFGRKSGALQSGDFVLEFLRCSCFRFYKMAIRESLKKWCESVHTTDFTLCPMLHINIKCKFSPFLKGLFFISVSNFCSVTSPYFCTVKY